MPHLLTICLKQLLRPQLLGVLVFAVAVGAWADAALAQDLSPEQIQQMHMQAALPGEEHAQLAAMEGTWETETLIWSEPDAEPIRATGRTEARMVLGGRFLVQTGTYPEAPTPVEVMSIIGFDRRSDEYTMIALDNTGTFWVSGQGPMNARENEAVLSGVDYDPISEAEQNYDFVLRWVDNDTFVSQVMFMEGTASPSGTVMVETTLRRSR